MADGTIGYKDWKIGGIPAWALGAAIVLVSSGFVYRYVAQPERDLLVARELNKSQQDDMNEYLRHVGRAPEVSYTFLDADHDRFEVGFFKDKCSLLTRETEQGVRTMLVRDLALDKDAAPKRTSLASPLGEAILEAAGRCVAQHPATMPFVDKQEFAGCWVITHRIWQDGCELLIPYDSCHRQGAPTQWARCVH